MKKETTEMEETIARGSIQKEETIVRGALPGRFSLLTKQRGR
jgi:hypothetical protein